MLDIVKRLWCRHWNYKYTGKNRFLFLHGPIDLGHIYKCAACGKEDLRGHLYMPKGLTIDGTKFIHQCDCGDQVYSMITGGVVSNA